MSIFKQILCFNWYLKIYLALAFALISLNLQASETGAEHRVHNPRYGQALFHFFQGNDLMAITQLMVARERPQSIIQRDESDLLLADLYYDYGLIREADHLFARLINENTSQSLRNRVWFNLARIHYEQGFYERALNLLSRIDGKMRATIDAEKQYLLTILYLKNQRFDLATQASQHINRDSVWSLYARYNLGVSLITDNQFELGSLQLEELGQLLAGSSEKQALRDQSNLSLGLSQLKHQQPGPALTSFSRIRLKGPVSHEALLGAGWAWNNLSQTEKALVPWLELTRENTIDAATQEALLAIPTSLEDLQKFNLAVQYYDIAATQYEAQLETLNQVVESVRQNELIDELRQQALIDDHANIHQYLPRSITAPYLHILFASEKFQREVKRYQDLLDISGSLLYWNDNLPVLELMLFERARNFAKKLPQLEKTHTFDKLEQLKTSRNHLANRLNRVETEEDYLGLATAEEKEQLRRLGEIGGSLNWLKGQKNLDSQKDMHRLLSGILHWQIGTDYAPRVRRAKRELIILDLALDDSTYLVQSLNKVSQNTATQFTELENRLNGKQSQIKQFRQQVMGLIQQQENRINKLAIQALQQQQQHITQLRLNARYALARLYDKLASN